MTDQNGHPCHGKALKNLRLPSGTFADCLTFSAAFGTEPIKPTTAELIAFAASATAVQASAE